METQGKAQRDVPEPGGDNRNTRLEDCRGGKQEEKSPCEQQRKGQNGVRGHSAVRTMQG